MLIVSGIFAALAIKRRQVRFTVEASLAALIPWSGLQLIPYIALLSVLLLVFRRRDVMRDIAAVVVGGILGSLTLAAFFMGHGVWGDFLNASTIQSGTRLTIAQRLVRAISAPFVDPSAVLLLVALVLVSIASVMGREGWRRPAAAVGALLGVVVPSAMGFVGRYTSYYAWMGFIPMAAALARTLDRPKAGKLVQGAALALALLACGVGLPARLLVIWFEWDLRDAGRVKEFVMSHVRPTDEVFSIYEAYYPAKASARGVVLPAYIGEPFAPDAPSGAITVAERERINVLILKPECVKRIIGFFGGKWRQVAHYQVDPSGRAPLLERLKFGSEPYDIIIFRRTGSDVSTVRGDGEESARLAEVSGDA
jgi:hypothetical protein